MKFNYRHDGYGEADSWLELTQDWDAERKCYRTVIRTNDTTDHARLPLNIRWLHDKNIVGPVNTDDL
jgi:hypothetical protein